MLAAKAYAVMNAGGAVEKMREQVNSLSFTAALLLLYFCFTMMYCCFTELLRK